MKTVWKVWKLFFWSITELLGWCQIVDNFFPRCMYAGFCVSLRGFIFQFSFFNSQKNCNFANAKNNVVKYKQLINNKLVKK